ncbi:MAG: N-acetylneuraminate synthase family protein [Candidatus Caenarcaniphilales bacterium]|nr:N-acetylneuraminate synthase family protein [Candidatus Caenarcaniphilales bacterium]
MIIKIGNKSIGAGEKCLIVFEAGATHHGLEEALEMVKLSAEAGADAIKFQTIIADEIMSQEAKENNMIKFSSSQGIKQESIYNALKRRELNFDEWRIIREYCKKNNILFISTPSGFETLEWLINLKADAIKISKSDINFFPLVEMAAKSKLPIILDAREKFEEVNKCIEICNQEGNNNVIIMHCPSGYPAEYSGIHLSSILMIKNIFNVPVAFSDHSVGKNICIAALTLGACMIEKTITLRRLESEVEQFMSLIPDEFSDFIESIRTVEESLGDPRIIFNSRVNLENKRSIFIKHDISKGSYIKFQDLIFQRPGNGVSVADLDKIIDKKIMKDYKQGEKLKFQDVSN